jgi:hypothetical protein
MLRIAASAALLALCLAQPAQAALDAAACERLKAAGAMHAASPVGCGQLEIVRFSYVGFDGARHDDGEIMVMAAVAPQVRALFEALRRRGFPLAHARLIGHYGGDDAASMADNNTSGFNDRPITGGGPPSLHAYGLAIDINPLQNPYVSFEGEGVARYSPPQGTQFANRLARRPGKPCRPGMAEEVVALFAAHGFPVWGGYWDAPLDYQHFQVDRKLAERMARLPEARARALFERQRTRGNANGRGRDESNFDAGKSCMPGAPQ